MTYDNGAVRVTQNNLRSHFNELIHKEETAFEHFLMEQDRPLGLRSHHNQHTQQIGSQTGPGCISQRHERTVDKRLDFIMVLPRDIKVVTLGFNPYAQSLEHIGNHAQIAQGDILDTQAVAHHGCHSYKAADFNHIGQDAMFSTMQFFNPDNGDKIRSNATDTCAHGIEQVTKLLHIRFAGSIINGSSAFSQHGSHNNIGSTGYGSLIEQHVRSLQLGGLHVEYVELLIIIESGSQL